MEISELCTGCEQCPFMDPNIPSNLNELHITISLPDDVNAFMTFCKQNGWKGIMLDLKVAKDIMVTTTYVGDPKDAHQKVLEISQILKHNGYHVIRQKIETTLNNTMSRLAVGTNYYETHFAIRVPEGTNLDSLRTILHYKYSTHLSKNMFKQGIVMCTVRNYMCERRWHLSKVHAVEHFLLENMWEIDRIINEFCWFDTNIAHDDNWIKKGYQVA